MFLMNSEKMHRKPKSSGHALILPVPTVSRGRVALTIKMNKGRLSMHSNLRGFAKALVVLAPAVFFAGCATLSDADKATLDKASSDAASAQSTAASAQSAAQAAAQQAQQAADAAKAAQAAAEQAAAEARAASEKAEQIFNQRLKK